MAFRVIKLLEYETIADFPLVGVTGLQYKDRSTLLQYDYVNDVYVPNFEEFSEDITLTTNNNWHVITMPVNVHYRNVTILMLNRAGNAKDNGFRSIGSIQDRQFNVPSSGLFAIDVKVDANNQVEAYSSNRGQMNFTLLTARI